MLMRFWETVKPSANSPFRAEVARLSLIGLYAAAIAT